MVSKNSPQGNKSSSIDDLRANMLIEGPTVKPQEARHDKKEKKKRSSFSKGKSMKLRFKNESLVDARNRRKLEEKARDYKPGGSNLAVSDSEEESDGSDNGRKDYAEPKPKDVLHYDFGDKNRLLHVFVPRDIAERRAKVEEAQQPVKPTYYDHTKENRVRGAASYAQSTVEQDRLLAQSVRHDERMKTKAIREANGAKDKSAPGMVGEPLKGGKAQWASGKEERKAMLEAARKK